ncbi:MAG: hypothetical protein P8N61_02970 [Porticoccaceae bacterium]|nr:hypothetical protein [Porticoccaceae bacterium]
MSRFDLIRQTLWQNLGLLLSLAILFSVLYYLTLMMALVIRFESLPNYLNTHEWSFNIKRIWHSTPSWFDSLMIMKDEWLLEVGFMNYDYGTGISEWSLFIAPVKVFGVLILGILVSANYLLLRDSNRRCSRRASRSAGIAAGVGTTLVSLASITMSWVVCCSTPTWVVGLAMMGLGVSTSLWLEPIGIWVNIAGYVFLLASLYIAASRATADPEYQVAAYI